MNGILVAFVYSLSKYMLWILIGSVSIIILINVKMPTIVGILTFMSLIIVMLPMNSHNMFYGEILLKLLFLD